VKKRKPGQPHKGWRDAARSSKCELAPDDGVALKSMTDPNFDEDGNCTNETMREFLKTRIRPN
jgi:hypothetical protein